MKDESITFVWINKGTYLSCGIFLIRQLIRKHSMRYYLHFSLIFLAIWFANSLFGQETSAFVPKGNKGRFFIYWGWNQESYSKSDIHFKGQSYDFSLHNVIADDKESPFSARIYFNPSNITIPQYNFRIGYFFKENWSASLGMDHMKYVVRQGQTVKINGQISNTNTEYNGSYSDQDIVIKKGFLRLEHTDGLNYANVDIRRQSTLTTFSKISVLYLGGIGVGALIPRTDATLLGYDRNDEFHLAGYGFNALLGVQIKWANHFFVQSEYKFGYINMGDIRTTSSINDKADQSFTYHQINILFGSYFGF
ncbi:MAG: hypothetical protein U0T36_02985 [Saprospiraceae bacterium]|jgi:hypothetical protein